MATKQRSPSSGEERAGFNRWGATAFKSRRSAFLYGMLAGLLLWLGADAFCLGRWDRLLPLPAGAFGDAAALLLMTAWGAVVLPLKRRPRSARRGGGAESQKGRHDHPDQCRQCDRQDTLRACPALPVRRQITHRLFSKVL